MRCKQGETQTGIKRTRRGIVREREEVRRRDRVGERKREIWKAIIP